MQGSAGSPPAGPRSSSRTACPPCGEADLIVVLRDGRIAEQGSFDELIDAAALRAPLPPRRRGAPGRGAACRPVGASSSCTWPVSTRWAVSAGRRCITSSASRRLGHDVYYVEDSGAPPYDPRHRSVVEDCACGVDFLARTMDRFGLGERWAYRDVAGGACYGLRRERAGRGSTARPTRCINLCGTTRLREEHLRCPVRIYLQTDPVHEQIHLARGQPGHPAALAAHTHHFTYGESLGRPECPMPLRGFAGARRGRPVVLDLWAPPASSRAERFTTVATWRNDGQGHRATGAALHWSKHVNFLRFLDLPRLTPPAARAGRRRAGRGAPQARCRAAGWRLVERARAVARRRTSTRSTSTARGGSSRWPRTWWCGRARGWFSDRSVCYLAAGRPVVTQDTGFGRSCRRGGACSPSPRSSAAADAIERDQRGLRAARSRGAPACRGATSTPTTVLGAPLRDAGL